MLILAADTSGKNGSLALVRFEAEVSHTLELVSLEGGTFSAQLVPQIAALLKNHSLTKSDIDAFAVASGPGSFTGLRVGLAAIKALAEILQKPIAAVSVLEAIARGAEREGRVLAALDAGRGEIYCGEYEIRGTRARLMAQMLVAGAEFAEAGAGRQVVTPDAKVAEFAREKTLPVILIASPRADAIARLGFEKIQAGEVVSPEALDATYIRRTDAEIKKNIRPACASDASLMVALERQSVTSAHWPESFYAALFENCAAERISLVAKEEGELRAFLVARIAGDECELENVVVAETSRRRGWGSKLIRALLDEVRERKVARIFLEVRESNLAARALYLKCGFAISGRRASYYTDPREDAVLYTLRL